MSLIELRQEAVEKNCHTPRTKVQGDFRVNLKCLLCGREKASVHAANPARLYCWHSTCDAYKENGGVSVDELFNLKLNFEQIYRSTKKEPNAPIDAWLSQQRGLSLDVLVGVQRRYKPDGRNTGIGVCLFSLGIGSDGKPVENGRFLEDPPDGNKSHSLGKVGEKIWTHEGKQYLDNDETYLVEGIISSLSLFDMGFQSVACISSTANPEKLHLQLARFPRLVLLFDNDANGAGQKAMRRFLAHFPNSVPLLMEQGRDPNDLLVQYGSEKAAEVFKRNRKQYEFNAKLALTNSPQEHADIYYNFHGYPPGLFAFNGCTYFSILKTARGGDTPPYVAVARCLKATVQVISFIQDKSNPARPEYQYNLKIQPERGRSIEFTATGADLASNRRLNECFLCSAKIPWEGDQRACTALSTKITGDTSAPEVEQLQVLGLQTKTGTYVYTGWAVDTTGKQLTPTKSGFFQIGHKNFFRPPVHLDGKSITPAQISKKQVQEIYGLIRSAWGNNGVVALSWVVASWFVNQVKAATNFFPFQSLHGDPASGKSALTVILNAMQGRDGEGLPITTLNSKKGLTRTIGQLSGLFTALLEDNERNERAFDWSIILTAFNRGPLQVQAVFSNDLQTRESPFQGSLMFVQNLEQFGSKAERQRVISLHFKTSQLSDTSRAAYEKLQSMDNQVLAGIMLQVLIHRKHFEEGWEKEYEKAIDDLAPMDERRILQNHALILAFHRLFCSCFEIPQNEDVTQFFAEICRQKCASSTVRQTTLADHFFELMDTIDEDKSPGAWYVDKEKSLIFINIPRVENLIRNKGINLQITESLSKQLQQHPAWIRNSVVYRLPDDPETDTSGRPKQRRVWVFNLEWFRQNITENIKW